MITNIAEYLSITADKFPDKTAFVDSNRSITFSQLKSESEHIAYKLLSLGLNKKPVIVYLDKSVEVVSSFLGVAQSGNFYSPIDTGMPAARIGKIVDTLSPAAVITDRGHIDDVKEFIDNVPIVVYEDAMECTIEESVVLNATKNTLDSDLIYVLFTSGSTGVPKGVMISHRGLIDFVNWATDELKIDETFVFGNQTPFYFSFPIYEIYCTIKNGCTTYIIPGELFSEPANLMKYLDDNKITTIIWVPSALCMVSAFRALNSPHVDSLKRVWFGAEVMPIKQLNKWRKAYPDVEYINLYGPTEVTDTASAYRVNREFTDDEFLPIGDACRNKEILLLDDDGKNVESGEIGEICVRGSGIAYGYYNDPERSADVFVQNPLNDKYPEIIYKTGDLGKKNQYGELVYISRKDFQIKHMGRRIELGEIETNISSLDNVELCCCLYDANKKKIYAFYSGKAEENVLAEELKEKIPDYMLPNKWVHLDIMPLNLSGKTDRQKLKEMMR